MIEAIIACALISSFIMIYAGYRLLKPREISNEEIFLNFIEILNRFKQSIRDDRNLQTHEMVQIHSLIKTSVETLEQALLLYKEYYREESD